MRGDEIYGHYEIGYENMYQNGVSKVADAVNNDLSQDSI